MAEGGEVGFCTKARPHDKSCQYFSEGGGVSPDFIPDDEAPEDKGAPVKTEAPDFIPDDQENSPDFIPDDEAPEPGSFSLPTSVGDAAMRMGGEGLLRTPEDQAPDEYLTDEELKAGRDKAENAAALGSIVTGGGVAGLAGKAATAVADYASMGKAGSSILKGMISNGLIQGSDEVSKWMMGGNPEHPVAATIIATGLGGLIHGLGSKAASELTELAEKKIGNNAASWLAGLASAAKSVGGKAEEVADGLDKEMHRAGVAFFNKYSGLGKMATIGEMGREGYKKDGVYGAVKGAGEGYLINKAIGLGAKKIAAPVVLKILSSNTTKGILDAISHVEQVTKGANKLDSVVDDVFTRGAQAAGKGVNALEPDKKRQDLEEYFDGGGPRQDLQNAVQAIHSDDPQGFADGGAVTSLHKDGVNGVALHFPDQNILMSAAKARASNYLDSLRPSKIHPKLAFDSEPDTREQNKSYKKALDIAHSPLSVMEKIKQGTIEPDHIGHLNAMFPEVTNLLKESVGKRIVKAQVDGEMPPYHVRQGLSMLMGAPLSGEMTPANIQAAQAVFVPKAGPSGSGSAPGGVKKTSAPLSKSDKSYLTDDQARMARQQRTT